MVKKRNLLNNDISITIFPNKSSAQKNIFLKSRSALPSSFHAKTQRNNKLALLFFHLSLFTKSLKSTCLSPLWP